MSTLKDATDTLRDVALRAIVADPVIAFVWPTASLLADRLASCSRTR
jgi:hypothetical protein